MAFWDVSNPAKPKGIKDPDAILDYPIDFSAWLDDISDTYASHTVTTTEGLVCDSSSEAAGIITPILSGGTLGKLASFTIHIVTTGGLEDDRTFWLRIVDR